MSEPANEPNLFAFYNDTAGYAGSPASRQRALREIADGSLSERQQKILEQLDYAGSNGLTWDALSQLLSIHHGKVSGALSNLHIGGQVFWVRKTRNRSHPYVHIKYRATYTEAEICDTPKGKSKRERHELIESLLRLNRQAVKDNFSFATCLTIRSVVDTLNRHDAEAKANK